MKTVADQPASAPTRVVVVGCGFGGLFCARALKSAPVKLVVVDRNNYHLFQPLLYQGASAALSPADLAQPVRTILRDQKNSLVMLGEVQRVALEENHIYVNGETVRYDYLVLAPAAVDNYFGHPEWAGVAPGMKGMEQATRIRSRLLLSFERAELEKDPAERSAQLSFVIVGGGALCKKFASERAQTRPKRVGRLPKALTTKTGPELPSARSTLRAK
jgi:NADH dehydrogenase